MNSGKLPAKKLARDQYQGYWLKAGEFAAAMDENLARGNWNAAVMSAIHAAILANDALLIRFFGVKSASDKHDDAIRLLTTLFKSDQARKNSRNLARLINEKSAVEYTGKLLGRGRALDLCKKARRFIAWVDSLLPG
jgi:HEPN domain-containing protein